MTWRQITCAEADVLRHDPKHVPLRSKTDLSGQFGEPEVFTEWGLSDETPVMREHRYPGPDIVGPDAKPCEHYRFDPGEHYRRDGEDWREDYCGFCSRGDVYIEWPCPEVGRYVLLDQTKGE